jgi:hypothetical protein
LASMAILDMNEHPSLDGCRWSIAGRLAAVDAERRGPCARVEPAARDLRGGAEGSVEALRKCRGGYRTRTCVPKRASRSAVAGPARARAHHSPFLLPWFFTPSVESSHVSPSLDGPDDRPMTPSSRLARTTQLPPATRAATALFPVGVRRVGCSFRTPRRGVHGHRYRRGHFGLGVEPAA